MRPKKGSAPSTVEPLTYTPEQAAELLSITKLTLYRWRIRKLGPPFIRESARIVRYPRVAFHAWLDHAQRTVQIVPKRRKRNNREHNSPQV